MANVILTVSSISSTTSSVSFSVTTDNYLGGTVVTYVNAAGDFLSSYQTGPYGYETRTYTKGGLSAGTSYYFSADSYGLTSGNYYGSSGIYISTAAAPYYPPYFPYFPYFPFFPPFFPPAFTPAPGWSGGGTDVTLSNAMESISYLDGVAATNATSYDIASGSLPSGLSLNTSTGAITGTPADGTAGTYDLTITATGAGGSTTSSTITLVVAKETGQLFVYNSGSSQWVKGTMNTFADVGGTPTAAKNTVYIYNSATSQWEISQG